MKHFKQFYMTEKMVDKGSVESAWGKDSLYNEIYINPDKNEMMNIKIKNASDTTDYKKNFPNSIRFGITENEDIYVWTNGDILHPQMETKYKVKFKWKYVYYGKRVESGHKNPPLTEGLVIRLANMFKVNKIALKRL